MMTDRNTARAVGGLFIVGTLAGVLSVWFEGAIVDSADYLTEASVNAGRISTSNLLILVMGIALVALTIVIYPVLRRYSERLALGYVAARAVEGVTYLITVTVSLLALRTVSEEFVNAGASDANTLELAGDLLIAGRDWSDAGVTPLVFALSAMIFNYVLYRARLVPVWLSVWGLIAAPIYLAAGVMVIYGLEPFSTTQVVMNVPLAIQEMALALWLIVKGFSSTATPSEPQKELLAVGG